MTKEHLFNIQSYTARFILKERPVDGEGIAATDMTQSHVFILGFGDLGQSLALRLAQTGVFAGAGEAKKARSVLSDEELLRYAQEDRLHIKIIDRDPVKREAFTQRYPMFEKVADVAPPCRASLNNQNTIVELRRIAEEENNRLAVYISLGEDSETMAVGMGIYESLSSLFLDAPQGSTKFGGYPRVEVFVRVDQRGLEETLRPSNTDGPVVLHTFGSPDQICTPGLDREINRLDERARRVHALYPGPEWEHVAAWQRESSRLNAETIPTKLRAIGIKIVEDDSPNGATAPIALKDIKTGAEVWVDELTRRLEENVETLAIMEHRRWCIERLLAGWTHAPVKHVGKRQHHELVPWGNLDPASQYAKNRAMVKDIPRILGIATH